LRIILIAFLVFVLSVIILGIPLYVQRYNTIILRYGECIYVDGLKYCAKPLPKALAKPERTPFRVLIAPRPLPAYTPVEEKKSEKSRNDVQKDFMDLYK